MNRGSFMLLLMNLISFKLSPSNIGHVSIMLLAKKKKKKKKNFLKVHQNTIIFVVNKNVSQSILC